MSSKKAVSFLLLTLLLPAQARAWRETGHFTVCEIAYRHLSPQAKQSVDALMGGQDFSTSCTWPDMVRKTPAWKHTFEWHFINLEDDQTYPETINRKGDVVQSLIAAEDGLRDPQASTSTKAEHLKFLGHFAGDIHQPLHTGHLSDLGGNDIKVSWFGRTEVDYVEKLIDRTDSKREKVNLHKVWDLHLPEKYIADNALQDGTEYAHKAYADAVDQGVRRRDIRRWRAGTYLDWAAESKALCADAYAVGDGRLGQAYYDKNIVTVNRRLVQAGYRLAGILERALSGTPLTKAQLAMRERVREAVAPKPLDLKKASDALDKAKESAPAVPFDGPPKR